MSENSYFALANQYSDFQEKLMESMGEISTETEIDMAALEKEIVEKTDGVVRWNDYIGSQVDRISNEIEILKNFKSQLNNAKNRYEGYIVDCMIKMEVQEIEGKEYTIKKRKPSQVVEISDEKKLPIDAVTTKTTTTTTADKVAIKAMLKNGEDVPGARLVNGKISLKFNRRK